MHSVYMYKYVQVYLELFPSLFLFPLLAPLSFTMNKSFFIFL